MREPFFTEHAPRPRGPYSQAIIASGPLLWVSGQLPIDPTTGELVGSSFAEQAVQVFENLKAIVEGAGGKLADAVKLTVYLQNNDDFPQLNEIYRRYLQGPEAARTTIQSNLRGILIEVDAVVALSERSA